MRINGKNYRIPELDFDTVCNLEDAGISIFDIRNPRKKFMSIIRAFAALATGTSQEDASNLIQQHLLGGGTFEGWFEEITEAMEKSDFFQAMAKKEKRNSLKAMRSEKTEE